MIDTHQVKPLAARQRDVLRLIAGYYRATGEYPSVSYLARRLELRRNTVQEYIEALHHKGWLSCAAPAGLRCVHVR